MAQDVSGSSSTPSEKPEMDEEFQFLLCDNCREEVGCPKLLPCLHSVCLECLQETKPVNRCPVCKAPHPQTDLASLQDNLLFANLRAKLTIFETIQSSQDLVCNNCKKEGVYWCSDCQEFMCTACFESHQRYLKRENHEARAVKEIQANSSREFLTEFKNVSVMFCSNAEHKTQNLSIYCKACQRSMCCICTVLDSQHNGQHCHIRQEIQRRQQELLNMSMELREKKTSYDQTCSNLRELVDNMVEVKNKTRDLIQQKVDEMLRLVQEKGEQLLAAVQDQHLRQVQDTEEKLHNVELEVQRMESCKRLVEKMQLYASDQEVMDMYPLIKGSLEEVKRKQPPLVETQIQVGSFADVEAELQAFYERVTDERRTRETEAASLPVKIAVNQEPVGKAPVKRKSMQMANCSQTPAKCIKTEPDNSEWKQSARQADPEQPGTSLGDRPVGNGGSVWKEEDTLIISDDWFPLSSSESSDTDTPSCLNGCGEDESSNDVESVGLVLQQNSSSESSQDDFWRNVFQPPKLLFSGQGSLLFFDLKVLPEGTLHLVAVADEDSVFSVIIQPLLSLPSEDLKGCLCEYGLEAFLRYLLTLHQPILVGHDLWSLDFPALMNTLKAIKREEAFKAAVFGFLDALPLIQERCPNLLSYTLKSLDRKYFWGQLDESLVLDCAKTVKDLCTVLEVNPGTDRRPVVTYSSLQCYRSLQPLLTKGVLSRSTVQALALHGVSLSVLSTIYRKDPARGLQRFGRYLNSRPVSGGGKIQQLSRAQPYFEALPSTSPALVSTATEPEARS